MSDDLQARLKQQLDDAMSLCSGTTDRPHRPTYMPVGRESGQRYCPVCASRRACEAKRGKVKKFAAGLALPGTVADNKTRPSGATNASPAAEHDAIGGGDNA